MAKDPTAYLRRESRSAARVAGDTDNLKSVIGYMLDRGAFAAHIPAGNRKVTYDIRAEVVSLPWNPEAGKRIRSLTLYEDVTRDYTSGRRKSVRTFKEAVETVMIPNWDYDGIDPLVAREPFDRQVAHNWLDQQEKSRRACGVWSNYDVDHDVREYEACEQLTADHAGVAGAATFPYATGPEG